MGGIICPCSRKTAIGNLKPSNIDDKDAAREATLSARDPNKENTTFKVGQNNNNNITWKYGSFDKNQNDIMHTHNENLLKNSKSGNEEMESNKNNNSSENSNISNNNHDDSENEENEHSDISDLSNDENENENDDVNETNNKAETMPTTIPISTETVLVSNSGFEEINGEYRWFMQLKKWCLFRESKSYCIENHVDVQNVYTQLISLRNKNSNFRWDENIDSCWIIADFEGNNIYYAAPLLNNNTIPNSQWISVHGNKPLPMLSLNSDRYFNESKTTSLNNNSHKHGNSKKFEPTSTMTTTIYEENNENYEKLDENEDSLSDLN